jgi:signal transduction histidine kinase
MSPEIARIFMQIKSYFSRILMAMLFLFCQLNQAQQTYLDSLTTSLTKIENDRKFDQSDVDYINLLNEIAANYQYKNIDSLKFYSEKAISLSNKYQYLDGQGNAILNLSKYLFYNGHNEKGLKQLNTALEIAKQNENIPLQIEVLNLLGIQQMDFGNHAEALKAYLKAIDLATSINDIKSISNLQENVAIIYLSQKDYQQTLNIYKEVEQLNKQTNVPLRTAQTKCNITDVYIKLNDLNNASKYIEGTTEIFKKYESYEWLAYSYHLKGDICLKQDNLKLALYWYDKAMLLHKDLNDDRYKVPLLNSIAETYFKLTNYTTAESYIAQALEIATKLSLLEDSIKSYELLYKINRANKNYENALDYHEKYKVLSDSISRKENSNSLGVLKTKLEYEKQQKNAEIENNKQKTKQNIFMYLGLILLVIFGLIIFLLKKQSKARKLFNNELRLKTATLEKREEELSAINATKDKLFSIIGHDLKGPINALGSVLTMFNDNEITCEEFSTFAPKFKTDVDAISFTLNNLLSWGRTQMTGSKKEPTSFDMRMLAEENIRFLHEISINKGITITNNILTNTNVWADRNQIDVVIRNLLSNALKFTNKKGVIAINAIEKNNIVKISVTDNGIGMSPEVISKIFNGQETNLISTYGTDNEKGTGLGLSLCKEMVENNGGEIWVESKIDKGSTFHFTLPKKASKE